MRDLRRILKNWFKIQLFPPTRRAKIGQNIWFSGCTRIPLVLRKLRNWKDYLLSSLLRKHYQNIMSRVSIDENILTKILKGIVQPFELGGVTRLIRSAVEFCMADNLKKKFNGTISWEELKTNLCGLMISKMTLSNQFKWLEYTFNIYFPFLVRWQLRYKNSSTHSNTNQSGEVLLQGFRFFFRFVRDIEIIIQVILNWPNFPLPSIAAVEYVLCNGPH